jgi:hypothetical protein
MGEAYKWATLDNSDIISINESPDKSYYVLSTPGTEGISFAAPSGRYDKIIKTWELDGIYGEDVNLDTGFYCWKTGVYGYKTGYITKIKIYFADITSTDTVNINALALGFCRGSEVEIITKASTILERNSAENSITFEVDGNFYIDSSIIEDNKNGLLILPVRSQDLTNSLISPGVKTEGVFAFINSWKNSAEELQPRVISRVRSIFDAGSSLLNHNYSANGAVDNSLKMEVTISVDGMKDHLDEDGNFNTYHLSPETAAGLNSIKYYAPILKSKSSPLNYVFSKIYISDGSLSLDNNISLIGKKIESIQIPIDTGINWKTNPSNSIFTTNVIVKIGFGESPTEFITQDFSLAMKRADNHEVVWNINFSEGKPVYNGGGITIAIYDAYNTENPSKTCVRACGTEDSLNPDTIYNGNTAYKITPDIRVIFDFDARAQFMEMLYRKISALN